MGHITDLARPPVRPSDCTFSKISELMGTNVPKCASRSVPLYPHPQLLPTHCTRLQTDSRRDGQAELTEPGNYKNTDAHCTRYIQKFNVRNTMTNVPE